MTLIANRQTEEIGTHVLVIGVGRYPHLLGGTSQSTSFDDGGMGQLSSPPYSALAVADWFLNKYSNPGTPLRSLELLISGGPGAFGTGDVEPMPVEAATMDNIERAIGDWYARGDRHEENVLVFYFCGHGVFSGTQQALLAEDFGAKPLAPFDAALSFWDFHTGMRACRPKQQIFFVDACRTVSEDYLKKYRYYGRPVVDGVPSMNLSRTRNPVYCATDLGDPAFGREGEPSFFTRALLRAFDGAGCIDSGDGWVVSSETLTPGINAFLERLLRGVGVEQAAVQAHPSKPFAIHYLQGEPLVPVDVRCRPDATMVNAELLCLKSGAQVSSRPSGSAAIWEIDLPEGEYEFRASFAGGCPTAKPKVRYVAPPRRPVYLDCMEESP